MNDGSTSNWMKGFVNNLAAKTTAQRVCADRTSEQISAGELMCSCEVEFTQEIIDTMRQPLDCSQSHMAAIHSLSNTRFVQNHYASARSLQNRLLKLMKIEFGTVHANVGQILNNLATICLATGDHKDARIYLNQSVQIFALLGDSEKIEMAETLNLLANSFLSEGNFAVAEPLVQAAFSIAQRLIDDWQERLPASEIVPFLESYILLFKATGRTQAARYLEQSVQELQLESDGTGQRQEH